MPDTSVDPVQLGALLRELGLIPPAYTGEVVVTAATSDGSDKVTISV